MSKGIQIDRVKYFEKDGKIDIAYKKKEDNSDAVFIASFREQASPEFYEALQNLAPSVCQILELPVSVENKLIPYGVSFKYANDGAMSAVISAKLKLPAKDTCVSINTPRMKCPQDEVDAQESTALTKDSVQALWTVEREAQKYLRGDRAQMKLFGDNGEPNAQGA